MLLLSSAVCTVAVPSFIEMKLVLSVTKSFVPLLNVMLLASSAHEPLFRAEMACMYCTESLCISILSSAARLRSLSARHAASLSLRVIFLSCATASQHNAEISNSRMNRYCPRNDGIHSFIRTGGSSFLLVVSVDSFITISLYKFCCENNHRCSLCCNSVDFNLELTLY